MPGCWVQMLTFWRGSHYNIPSSGIFGFRSASSLDLFLLPDNFPGNGFHECCSGWMIPFHAVSVDPSTTHKVMLFIESSTSADSNGCFLHTASPLFPFLCSCQPGGTYARPLSQQLPNGEKMTVPQCVHTYISHIWFSCILLINPGLALQDTNFVKLFF